MKSKLAILASLVSANLIANSHAEVIISEYVEGSSFNKAIELYNSSQSTIELTNYSLNIYFNGNSSVGKTINLSGEIGAGKTYVIGHSSSDLAIQNVSQISTGDLNFNGDDAVTLVVNGILVDSIGQVGFDPGSYWGTSQLKTQNLTIRRIEGSLNDTNASNIFEISNSWSEAGFNEFSDLGKYGSTEPVPELVLGECGDEATLISSIQGNGLESPIVGAKAVVEAIVTGDFQESEQLNGFFIQEESEDYDNSSNTSVNHTEFVGG